MPYPRCGDEFQRRPVWYRTCWAGGLLAMLVVRHVRRCCVGGTDFNVRTGKVSRAPPYLYRPAVAHIALVVAVMVVVAAFE